MQELFVAWNAIKFGGAMVYPLLALGVLAIAIIIDRAVLYARCLRLPAALAELVETFGFSWVELEKELGVLGPRNVYGRFLQVIADNRNKPAWCSSTPPIISTSCAMALVSGYSNLAMVRAERFTAGSRCRSHRWGHRVELINRTPP
jgi:branched-subunit amino acid ABC-type transport system permease component